MKNQIDVQEKNAVIIECNLYKMSDTEIIAITAEQLFWMSEGALVYISQRCEEILGESGQDLSELRRDMVDTDHLIEWGQEDGSIKTVFVILVCGLVMALMAASPTIATGLVLIQRIGNMLAGL